jgi:hypothetical protein
MKNASIHLSYKLPLRVIAKAKCSQNPGMKIESKSYEGEWNLGELGVNIFPLLNNVI